ncbi:MAG: hypothetical protein HKN44_00030 [Ilumatobacter sp.]|nr:hypothetical protein [Ilumatobacter sp.]
MDRRSMLAPLLLALTAACSGQQSSATGEVPGLPADIARAAADEPFVAAASNVAVDTVVMIGDSITVASAPALHEALTSAGFGEVIIVAQQGKRMALTFGDNPSGATVARSLLDGTTRPDGTALPADDRAGEVWVVALGTNDVAQYSDPSERAAAVNEVLNAVPDEVPLVWVDTFVRDRPDATVEVNEMIEARLRQRGNATIARWSAVADDEGNLRDDGVHPRDAGSVVFADAVASTVADFVDVG